MRSPGRATRSTVTRREVLKTIGAVVAGLGAAACAPLRVAFDQYPEAFRRDADRLERALRAFVTAVIPGASERDPNLTRAFSDRFYRFARFRHFFASDLCTRASMRYGTECFERLTRAERTRVIQDGLAAGGVTGRLYSGAVFLAQITYYAGVYDPERGCELIDFDGCFRGRDELSYPEPRRFLAASLTVDGNPA